MLSDFRYDDAVSVGRAATLRISRWIMDSDSNDASGNNDGSEQTARQGERTSTHCAHRQNDRTGVDGVAARIARLGRAGADPDGSRKARSLSHSDRLYPEPADE